VQQLPSLKPTPNKRPRTTTLDQQDQQEGVNWSLYDGPPLGGHVRRRLSSQNVRARRAGALAARFFPRATTPFF
jgi:hypothetical protein